MIQWQCQPFLLYTLLSDLCNLSHAIILKDMLTYSTDVCFTPQSLEQLQKKPLERKTYAFGQLVWLAGSGVLALNSLVHLSIHHLALSFSANTGILPPSQIEHEGCVYVWSRKSSPCATDRWKHLIDKGWPKGLYTFAWWTCIWRCGSINNGRCVSMIVHREQLQMSMNQSMLCVFKRFHCH